MPHHAAKASYAPGPGSLDQRSRPEIRPAWVDRALFPFPSRFADVDGHRMHYVDEGQGPTILFLHPGPGWSFCYREFVLGLRGQFRCVALDYPGFGLSVARIGYGFSLEEHSRAVERFIETLGLRDVTLMVHDAGGPIGLGVAARRPEWFRAFVLVSTFAWPLTEYRPVRLMLRLVSSPPLRLLNGFANLLPRVVARFAPQRRKLTAAERAAIVGAFPTWAHRGRILTLFRDLAVQDGYLRAVEQGLTARLHDRPALIMYGELDPVRKLGFDKRFERIFPRYRSIAYRMLGSAADAEDMVQETFLRCARAPATEVASLRAYLVTVVTRLCIDHQRSAWIRHRDTSLPEPVPTAALLDPLDPAERAQSLSIAFLVLLRTLTPVERAVFLLRDVFDVDYAEIAAIVRKSEDHCRQITRRARQHVAAARPRFEATRAEAAALAERFSALCRAGDRSGLATLLAHDVTFIVDGGATGLTYGKARAIDRPMHGAEAVARFLIGVQRQAPTSMRHRVADVNGQPGLLVYQDGALHALLSLDVGDGRVRRIYLIGDPEKLGRLRAVAS